MRININTNNLIEAVTIGSQMACKSNVVPIFENTKITVRSGLITASSFNGETSITKSVNTQCHDDIPETSFLVNKKDFLDVLGTIGDETVQVEIGQILRMVTENLLRLTVFMRTVHIGTSPTHN